jgi:DNA-binding MarR family transcriptional regulator
MTDSLGFLIGDVSRLLRRRFDERARAIGVTRAQWRTLAMLNRNEGLNQGRLAELLEVEPITLCRMVDRLEEAGHVERRRDPSDRRAWKIFLTAQSRPLIAQLRVIADELLKHALIGVAPDEQAQMARALDIIQTNLAGSDENEAIAHG